MADIRAVEAGVIIPRSGGQDLNGYKAKPPLFPPGEPKSPYVREKLTGMIWHYQPYMDDMGDVLEPCWEAPAAQEVMIPTHTDISKYAGFGSPLPEPAAAPQPEPSNPSVLAEPPPQAAPSEPKRKGAKAKGQPRATDGADA